MKFRIKSPLAGRGLMSSPDGLKGRVIRAASWSLLGQVVAQFLALGSNLVLTRLLFPEAFGIMTIVYFIMTGLHLFSDFGTNRALVQSPHGENPIFVNTAWTIQVIRGFALAALASALAQPISWLYEEPQLASLIPAASVIAAIGGLESPSMYQLERRMNFKPIIMIDLGCQALSIAVMLTLALIYPSPWALVGGGIASSTARTLASHTMFGGIRPKLSWDRESANALFRFGSWIFFSTALTFIGAQGDRAVMGHYVGLERLGVYGIALRLVDAVLGLYTRIAAVLYSAFGETFRSDPTKMMERYERSRLALDVFGLLASGFLCVTGDIAVSILFDERYHDAGWMLMLLSAQIGLSAMSTPSGIALVSIGKTQYTFAGSLGRALWVIALMPLGWHLYGEVGLITAVATANLPTLAVNTHAMMHHKLYSPKVDLRAIALFIAGIGCGAVVKTVAGWIHDLT